MQRVAWDVMTGLAERGHEVEIVTTAAANGRRCEVPEQLADRLKVHYPPRTAPAQYAEGWWKESRAAYLRARDQPSRPDIVLGVSAGAWSVLPLLKGSVPSCKLTALDCRVAFQAAGRRCAWCSECGSQPVLDAEGPHHVCAMPKVVAVGPMAYAALRHPLIRSVLADDKVVMIQNGVDTDKFRPRLDAKPALTERLAIPRTHKVLLWASRLHVQKGTHLALNAFAKLEAPGLGFVIIGEGPERANLERQARTLKIADRVRFVGAIDYEDMPRWLSLGDAFVFTSIREEAGLPLNILEAMAVNLPIVLSASLASFLGDAPSVHAVDPSDATAVARAMQRAVSAPDRGREAIERHYSRHVMVQRYEEIFQKLLVS